MITHNLVK